MSEIGAESKEQLSGQLLERLGRKRWRIIDIAYMAVGVL